MEERRNNFFIKGEIGEDDRMVWSTKLIEDLLEAEELGVKVKVKKPFYEGNVNLKKGDIVFEYTDEELEEIVKCSKDIVYFANNYCKLMTDDGIQAIKLRPYQVDLLRTLQENRFNIVLASRQIGKCVVCAEIQIKDENDKIYKTSIDMLYYETKKQHKKLNIFEKIKYNIYKLIYRLNK